YRRRMMEEAFPAANGASPTDLVASVAALCRTDAQRKDAHVIATAIVTEADVILTENIADFPADLLSHYGLRASAADDFCIGLYRREPATMLAGVRAHRASLQRPAYDPDQYNDFLANPKFGLR